MILRYRSLRNWKYQTMAPYGHDTGITGYEIHTDWLKLDKEGYLLVRAGYCWDGASGPTWDSKCSMRGSLVHDALYQLMRLELLPQSCKPVADRLLRDICIEDGMWPIRAAIWCAGVKLCGGASCTPGSEPEQIIYEVGR
jgi:hypothetical protein